MLDLLRQELVFQNNDQKERNQDGGIGVHEIHLSSQVHQEYIYKWNNFHRAPAEDWQKTWTPKRETKIPSQLGRMKERKIVKRNKKWGQQPWWEADGEENSLSQKCLPTQQWGNELGQTRPFEGFKENAVDGLWTAGQSKNCRPGLCHCPAQLSLNHVSPVVEEGWVLESVVWNMDRGMGQLLTMERQPERTGIMSSTARKVSRKSPGHHGSKSCGIKEVELPLQPPSLPTDFSLCRHQKGHPSEQAHPPLKSRLLSPKLQGPEHCPYQSLLRNQPWVPLPERRSCQCWWVLSAKVWG